MAVPRDARVTSLGARNPAFNFYVEHHNQSRSEKSRSGLDVHRRGMVGGKGKAEYHAIRLVLNRNGMAGDHVFPLQSRLSRPGYFRRDVRRLVSPIQQVDKSFICAAPRVHDGFYGPRVNPGCNLDGWLHPG